MYRTNTLARVIGESELEKKFWLVGLVVWFLIQAFLGFNLLFDQIFGIMRMIPEWGLGVIVGVAFAIGVQVAVIAWISSWIWEKYKAKKG